MLMNLKTLQWDSSACEYDIPHSSLHSTFHTDTPLVVAQGVWDSDVDPSPDP